MEFLHKSYDLCRLLIIATVPLPTSTLQELAKHLSKSRNHGEHCRYAGKVEAELALKKVDSDASPVADQSEGTYLQGNEHFLNLEQHSYVIR